MFRIISFSILGLASLIAAAPASANDRSRICEAVVESRSPPSTSQTCLFNPTSRVEVFFNLDAGLETPPVYSPSFAFPDMRIKIRVQDSLGDPRMISISWRRSVVSGEWIFEAGIEPEDATRPPRFAFEDLVFQGSGMLRFDSNGLLIGPMEIPISFEFSGDVEDEQEIVFSFVSAYGVSRQFALDSTVLWFAEDGAVCLETPPHVMPVCRLSDSLAHEASETPMESLTIGAGGELLSSRNERVQGRAFDRFTGERTHTVTDARVSGGLLPGTQTRRIDVAFRLDATVPIETTIEPRRQEPGGSLYRLAMTAYDSLGASHFLTLTFWRTAEHRWQWELFQPLDLAGIYSNSPNPIIYEVVENGHGALSFDAAGRLATVTQEGRELLPGSRPSVSPRFHNHGGGDRHQEIELDFGIGTTSLADANTVVGIENDGIPAGRLTSLWVSADLVLTGGWSSGVDFPIAELAVASAGERVCEFECSNGRDDDGDGRVDAPDDAGCDSGLDNWERSRAIACDDGYDNDLDGVRDYPEDPGCETPTDTDESPSNIVIQVVDRLAASRFEDERKRLDRSHDRGQILVLAVLNRGGVPLSRLDPSSLRLEPSGLRPFEPGAHLTGRYPDMPDADCNGYGDRLLFFRIEESREGRRPPWEVCLSGSFEARSPGGLSIGGVPQHRDWFEPTYFRSCTTGRRRKT